jgi:hypothetical protein
MAFSPLQKGKKNSVPTTLSADISADADILPVTDRSVFYDEDGTLITEGIELYLDDSADNEPEEITITDCDGVSGPGTLTGATRGVNADGDIGIARAWAIGTKVSVNYTTGIHKTIRADLNDLDSRISGGLVSNPPQGYKKVTNLYFDPNTGQVIFDHEN